MKHQLDIEQRGLPLESAKKVLIMLHGRGASASSILDLAPHLNVGDYALLAPQATNHTWYPHSFMVPPQQNQPWLDSALEVVGQTVAKVVGAGIPTQNIFFLGFSQGACLASEYIARNATAYGGAAIFSGGLIGDKIYPENYQGDFGNTPVFVGCSDIDSHVPVERIEETTVHLKKLNADVTQKIYINMGHTIVQDEIEMVNQLLFK